MQYLLCAMLGDLQPKVSHREGGNVGILGFVLGAKAVDGVYLRHAPAPWGSTWSL